MQAGLHKIAGGPESLQKNHFHASFHVNLNKKAIPLHFFFLFQEERLI